MRRLVIRVRPGADGPPGAAAGERGSPDGAPRRERVCFAAAGAKSPHKGTGPGTGRAGGCTVLYVDIPTLPELRALAETRADACVSIYLPTSPLPQESPAQRTAYRNLAGAALQELAGAPLGRGRLDALRDELTELDEDDEFWRFQARSLAVLATPDSQRTFRLPNRLTPIGEVADRFYLKPLLRAVTFPHEA